jgi:DNA mismatch repair protein MutS
MPRDDARELTPMMLQYSRIKAEHKDAILLFRMGDFYETFLDDAKVASRVLGLALTTRDKGSANPVPLAGIPYHALETYLARLVAAGHKVAICDQVEDPRTAKGLVRREVTEIITPGTVLSASMLNDRRASCLVAISPGPSAVGLARLDPSTGEFSVSEHEPGDVRREILRADAAELLVPEGSAGAAPLAAILADVSHIAVTRLPDWEFGLEAARQTLESHFGVANLDGFGLMGLSEGLAAAGAALRYLKDLKKRDLKQITSVRRIGRSDHMILDETTQRNLELVEPLERGLPGATLLDVLDRTATPMGARLLRQWVLYPLVEPAAIVDRLDAVEGFVGRPAAARDLAGTMGELCDVARVTGRVGSGHANPRDLVALRRSVELLPAIRAALEAFGTPAVATLAAAVPELDHVAIAIRDAIVESPPPTLREGGVIRDGHDARLDELKAVARGGKDWIARLQAAERERTGIQTLKVGYNRVFGYYIEITKPYLHLAPADYLAKQTLVSGARFATPELREHESRVLTAEDDMVRLEQELFDRVRERVAGFSAQLQEAAGALAAIDALLSLASAAVDHRYVRPTVDEGGTIAVSAGRHPVVERLLGAGEFVANDVRLDRSEHQVLLITGPNMAGKSTYLRQVALIAIMAQMGSFVPAESARIGLVDRVFTRIGATDALARGRSTFLVEMGETANILRNATARSLVILDEVGRGTSTFDGLAIAWAVTEHLHDDSGARPRTLFATHYHELTELAEVLPNVRNMNVLVQETGGTIVFLRRIVPGAADQSYGIHVAKLAGMPESVVVRAREILKNLESAQYTPDAVPRLAGGEHGPLAAGDAQLRLFEGRASEIEREIAGLDVDRMTPIDALRTLSELKKRGTREP